MTGEALGGISCVYDLWAQMRVDVGRRQRGGVGRRFNVSMVGGSIRAVTPSNASNIKKIRNSWSNIKKIRNSW